MASSVASWASMRRRVGINEDASMLHDSERCRALLLRLVREVVAFVRQHEQRTRRHEPDATSSLWMSAVSRVCEARMQELQGSTGELLPMGERVRRTAASPREVIAEAMVQELLASVAAIRLAETETTVLEEVENVETLRSLRATLKQDEAELRRVVKDGAGEDARLCELQRILRDEFLQELAQSKAQGLADSLHNEASLQFAWETIQEQKKEIVRLRAENEQLQGEATRSDGRLRHDDQPRHAIHQLRLQLSSHPDHNFRILQEQVAQLEATLGHHDGRIGRDPATSLSGFTINSSRDDEDFRRDSVLLPSHLATMAPRECEQCRRHSRTLVECHSELKQLRAQCAADENALVKAEKDHLHMKREHVALTSALVASKQKQEELRKMVLDISDGKLKLETLRETQQRSHDHQVDQLQRQLTELEAWRERSDHEKQNHRSFQDALEGELQRVRLQVESLQSERDAARVEVTKLTQELKEMRDKWTVDQATAMEANTALASTDGELRSVKKELQAAREQIKQFEATTARLRLARDQATASSQQASSEKQGFEQRLGQKSAEVSRLQAALSMSESGISKLERELTKGDASVSLLSRQIQEERSSRDAVVRKLQEARGSLEQRQQYVAELEGRLDRSEEERSVQANQLEEVEAQLQQRGNEVEDMKSDVKRHYEVCQRLEIQLADSREEAAKCQHQLLDANAAVKRLQDTVDQHSKDREGVANSSRAEVETLTHELSETKTTILMWMSKYHGVVNAKSELEVAAKAAEAAVDELRENYRSMVEEKERLLVRIDKMAADVKHLNDDRQATVKEITQLKTQMVVDKAELTQVRHAYNDTTEKLRAREAERADHLVEIGVLQADNGVLRRELEHGKDELQEAEAQLHAQEFKNADEVAALKKHHQVSIATTSFDVKALLTAHDRILANTLQRLAQHLSAFDERLICTAETAARAQDQRRIRHAAARPQFGSSQISPLSESSPCARCRQQHGTVTESAQPARHRVKMSVASTQTTHHKEHIAGSVDVLASDVARNANGSSRNLDAQAQDSTDRYAYLHVQDRRSTFHSPSSQHNSASTRAEDGCSLEDDASDSSSDIEVPTRSQVQLHESECNDAMRGLMSNISGPVETTTGPPNPKHSTQLTQVHESHPSGDGVSYSSVDREQLRSMKMAHGQAVVTTFSTRDAMDVEESTDPAQSHLSGNGELNGSGVENTSSIQLQPFSSHLASASQIGLRSDVVDREVFDLVMRQFTSTERVLTAQWLRVQDLVLKTAKRLNTASTRAALSVATWRRSPRYRECVRVVDSVACQTSLDLPSRPVAGHTPKSSRRPNTDAGGSPEGVSDPENDEDEAVGDVSYRRLCHTEAAKSKIIRVEKVPKASRPTTLVPDLLSLEPSNPKISSIRHASITQLSQLKLLSKDAKKSRQFTRISRSVVMLHVARKPKPSSSSTTQNIDPVLVDASAQTAHVETSSVNERVVHKWGNLASQLLRRSTWRSVITVFHNSQRRLRFRRTVTEKFALLTWKLLARHKLRGLLSISSSQMRSIKTATTRCVEEDRERRVVTRWESIVRSAVWRFSTRQPLKLVVETLRRRAAKPRKHHAHLQWQLLRWKLDSYHHERTAKFAWLKCVALQRRTELERTLRRHFVAWHGLVRGLIHHPSLSESDSGHTQGAKTQDAGFYRPANVSTSLQIVMQECVTLLRQYCHETKVPSDESRASLPSQWPYEAQSIAYSSVADAQSSICSSTGVTNVELLIRLLLQSSEQIGQWRDAMDKKLEEIRVREGQLSRLQTHCTELQAIIDKYHERQRQHVQVSTERHVHEEVSLSTHQVHTTQLIQQHPAHLRALEEERRRLNQRNIAMLEGVIVQLQEAKDSRVWLYQRLQSKTKQLERARWQLEQAHTHSALLRAFYQWCRHTSCLRESFSQNQVSS